MKAIHLKPVRILSAIAVSTVLMTGFTMTAWAEPDQPQQTQQNWAQHRQNWVKARLAKMAERLEIKSSQQGAWQAFAKVIEEPANMPIKKPDATADAATMARSRADFAAMYAKRMAQIADATAKLQEVLVPDQRKTLDQMAHEFHHHRHHRHHRHQEQDGNDEGQRRPDNR